MDLFFCETDNDRTNFLKLNNSGLLQFRNYVFSNMGFSIKFSSVDVFPSNNNVIVVYSKFNNLYAFIFTKSLTSVVKFQFRVCSIVYYVNESQVTVLKSGGLFVLFIELSYPPTINAVVYNSDASILKSEFLITTCCSDSAPRSAALVNGGLVIVWKGGSNEMVYATIYDNTGTEVIAPFQESGTLRVCTNPRVVGLPNGDFVITWSGTLDTNVANPASNCNVYQSIFSSTGINKLNMSKVNSIVVGEQKEQSISVSSYNCYIISWIARSVQVFTKRFFYDGSIYQNDVQINTDVTNNKTSSRITFLQTRVAYVVQNNCNNPYNWNN